MNNAYKRILCRTSFDTLPVAQVLQVSPEYLSWYWPENKPHDKSLHNGIKLTFHLNNDRRYMYVFNDVDGG